MTIQWSEPEIRDGMRAWDKAQELLAGEPAPDATVYLLEASWYDTGVDDHEGAFALVREGTPAEDLVGDIVQVERSGRAPINVYVLGTSPNLPTDFALARSAAIRIVPLYIDEFAVDVRVV